MAALGLTAGCVCNSTYNQAVGDLEATRIASSSKDQQIASLQKDKAQLTTELEAAKVAIASKDKQLSESQMKAQQSNDLTMALSAAKQASVMNEKELASTKTALKDAEAKIADLQKQLHAKPAVIAPVASSNAPAK